jgi:hypothetical protein
MQYPETSDKSSKSALAAFKTAERAWCRRESDQFCNLVRIFRRQEPRLKKTVDALSAGGGKPDVSAYAELYDRFIIAGANMTRDREWSDQMDTVTERTVSALTASGSETEEYGETTSRPKPGPKTKLAALTGPTTSRKSSTWIISATR